MTESSSISADSPKTREPFILLHRSTVKREALIILALFAVLLVFRYRALPQFGSWFLGGASRDAGLYIWLLQSNCRDLVSLPWFNTQAFYPYTETLAWSDNFILPSLAVCPFLKLGARLPVLWNTLMFTTALLNGYCTYRLCFELSGKSLPAFMGGALFMVSGVLGAQLGHPQLQFVFWIPLGILLLFRLLQAPSTLLGFLLGLTVFLSFITTVYYSVFLLTAIAAVAFVVVLLRPKQFTAKQALISLGGFALGFAPFAAFLPPYLDVRDTFGARGIYEAFYFSATGASYLSAAPLNYLYSFTSSLSHSESNLFPGAIVLVLSLLGFLRLSHGSPVLRRLALIFLLALLVCAWATTLSGAWGRFLSAVFLWGALALLIGFIYWMGRLERRLNCTYLTNRGVSACFLFLSFLFFAISLGPLGNPEKHQTAAGVYTLFYSLFPGYNSIRAISRAGIVAVFGLIVLGTLALSHLCQKRNLKLRWLLLLFGVALIENWLRAYPLDPAAPRPEVFEKLTVQTPDDHQALVVLPFTKQIDRKGEVASWGEYAELNTNYMNWTFPLNRPLVNGYSGQRSKLMKEFPAKTAKFPDLRSLSALSQIAGLRYVVYLPKYDSSYNKEKFAVLMSNAASSIKLLSEDSEGNYLFEFVRERRVGDDQPLLTPSYPAGKLSLQFSAALSESSQDIPVTVFMREHYGDLPLQTISVPAGETVTRPVAVPSKARVRPLMLVLKSDGPETIYFKPPAYSWKEP